jgi:hypothetical protein
MGLQEEALLMKIEMSDEKNIDKNSKFLVWIKSKK